MIRLHHLKPQDGKHYQSFRQNAKLSKWIKTNCAKTCFLSPLISFHNKNPPKLKGIYCNTSKRFAFIYIFLYEKKQHFWSAPLIRKTYQSNYYSAQTRIHLEKRCKGKRAMFRTLKQPSQTSTRTSSTGTCRAWNTCAPRLSIFCIPTISAKKTRGFGAVTAEIALAPKQQFFLRNPRLRPGSRFFLHLPICSFCLTKSVSAAERLISNWYRSVATVETSKTRFLVTTTTVIADSTELTICQEQKKKMCRFFKPLFINFKTSIIYSCLPIWSV